MILFMGLMVSCSSAATINLNGEDMVDVPEGWFTMGIDNGEYNEGPGYSVYVNAFKIDRTEVTASQFAEFLNTVGNPQNAFFTADKYSTIIGVSMVNGLIAEQPENPERYIARPKYEDSPANNVSWYGAAEYCRSKGKRLPTEAQWEKAARGTDERAYPWGDSPPSPSKARYDRTWDEEGLDVMIPAYSMLEGASPYGALNMAGNVWEWVEDYYFQNYCNYCRDTDWDYLSEEVFGYHERESVSKILPPKRNPSGPSMGHFRVLRGGSWFDSDGEHAIRATHRFWLREPERYVHTGFRCVSGPPRQKPAYVPPPETVPQPLPTPAAVQTMVEAKPMLNYIGDVFFEYNKSTIEKKYLPFLDDQTDWLRDNPEKSMLLVGYCDDRGSYEYNYTLGLSRALAVRSYLIGNGIDPSRIGISSESNESLFCFLLDSECRALNRRTRIMSYDPDAGIPAGFLGIKKTGGTTQASQAVLRTEKSAETSGSAQLQEAFNTATVELISPQDVAEFSSTGDVDFRWKPVPQATNYRCTLARDRDFIHILLASPPISELSYLVTSLDYGTYYYKVEAMTSDGHVTGSSPVQSFIIVPKRPLALR